MANKKCLVFETLGKISDLQRITESADGFVRLSGTFGCCGVRNNNNRVYNKKNYGMMVEALQKEISQGSVLGELEHPNSMNINLDNVSHMIESIEMSEDGIVTGTIKLLDTPKGRIAKAIAEASGNLFISSRAAGSIDESGNVTLTTLKTYDLVGTPGFSQAKLSLNKGQKFESLCESAEEGITSWMIIDESDDDDLLSSDSDDKDDKKNSDDKDNKEDNKDDKKDSEDKKDSDDKKDDKDKSDDDDSDDKKDDDSDDDNDNNKNNKDKVTMEELKKSIDALKEKVESLQADLHVAQESLAETNVQSSIKFRTLNEKLENIQPVNYAAIESWVKDEFSPEFKESLMNDVDDAINENSENTIKNISEGIQAWTINEFAPLVEGWVTNEFAPIVEGWVTDEFAPVVESYITEEFAPTIEGWINEELMPTIDNWINEECIPEHKTNIINEVNNNVSEFFESKQTDKLSAIDNLLEAIENKENKDEALELLKEQNTDNKYKGIYCVENMPAQYAPQWAMLSEAKQQEIIRSSRMYDFTKTGILENFWSTVDFKEEKPVVEQQTPASNYHSMIFEQAMRLRK